MYEHILIATDGSELGDRAVSAGLSLARCVSARVTVLMVTEPPTNLVPEDLVGETSENEHDAKHYPAAAAVLAEARERAQGMGLQCTTLHVLYKFPAETITEVAQARACDLIVMASHGRRGVARLLLGGETVRVLTYASVPVLVCR